MGQALPTALWDLLIFNSTFCKGREWGKLLAAFCGQGCSRGELTFRVLVEICSLSMSLS